VPKSIIANLSYNSPDEFCEDNRQCIEEQLNWKDRLNETLAEKQTSLFYLVAANVTALYPSLCSVTVNKATECA